MPGDIQKRLEQARNKAKGIKDTSSREDTIRSAETCEQTEVVTESGEQVAVQWKEATEDIQDVKVEDGPVILIIEVVIGQGKKENIEVRQGYTAIAMATEFAQKHGLGESAIPKLTSYIESELEELEGEHEMEEDLDEEQAQAELEQEQEDDIQFSDDDLPLYEDQHVGINNDAMGDVNDDEVEEGLETWMQEGLPVGEEVVEDQKDDFENSELDTMEDREYALKLEEAKKIALEPTERRFTAEMARENVYDAMASGKEPDAVVSRKPTKVSNDGLQGRHVHKKKQLRGSSSTSSVFNRLYSSAAVKKKWIEKMQKKKEMESPMKKLQIDAKSRTMVGNRNLDDTGDAHIGERLYREGLANKERKLKKTQERQELKESDAALPWLCPKCTFSNLPNESACQNTTMTVVENGTERRWKSVGLPKGWEEKYEICGQKKPSLFQPTLMASKNRRHSISDTEIHSKLYVDDSLAQRRDRTYQAAEKNFQSTYTFRPKLAAKSIELTANKGRVDPEHAHDYLYQDAERRRSRLNAKAESHHKKNTFQPDIGASKRIVADKKQPSDVSWSDRLSTLQIEQMKEQRIKLMQTHDPTRDAVTGQKFFQPKIGRGPSFNRNEGKLPIGEFLHASRNEFLEIKRQQQVNVSKLQQETHSRSYVSKKSERVLHQRKLRSFKVIFDKLAATVLEHENEMLPDALEPRFVNLSVLKPETSRVVQSIFREQEYKTIDRESFYALLDHVLCQRRDVTYSQVVFTKTPEPVDTTNEELEEEELTFQPKLNSTSKAIASQKGRVKGNVFDHLNKQHQIKLKHRENEVLKKEEQIASECPFKPQLVANNKNYQDLYTRLGYQSSKDTNAHISSKPGIRPTLHIRPIDSPPKQGNIKKNDNNSTEPSGMKEASLSQVAALTLDQFFVVEKVIN